MSETLPWLLTYTLIPVAAIMAGGYAALLRPRSTALISAFEHFASGVVFFAVAIELLPGLYEIHRPVPMILGFVAGVLAMMASKRWLAAAGILVPMAVDLFVDGLLIAIGLAAGEFGGMILLAGLTIEVLSRGLSSTPSLVRQGAGSVKAVLTMGGLGLMILLGASAGYGTLGAAPPVLALILGFGVSALLYLVTEELLVEAHETRGPSSSASLRPSSGVGPSGSMEKGWHGGLDFAGERVADATPAGPQVPGRTTLDLPSSTDRSWLGSSFTGRDGPARHRRTWGP